MITISSCLSLKTHRRQFVFQDHRAEQGTQANQEQRAKQEALAKQVCEVQRVWREILGKMEPQGRKDPKGTRVILECQVLAAVVLIKPNLLFLSQSQKATQERGYPSNLTGSSWMKEGIIMLPVGNLYAAFPVFTTLLMTSLWPINTWPLGWFTMDSTE